MLKVNYLSITIKFIDVMNVSQVVLMFATDRL